MTERLISVPAARSHIDATVADPILKACMNNVLDSLPAVDAVKVVRCKDCKWYQESKLLPPNKFCYRLMHPDPGEARRVGYNCSPDDFCSYGERRYKTC